MVDISLPYGKKTINLNLPEKRLKAVLTSRGHQQNIIDDIDQQEIVEKALNNPIGSSRLKKLARKKKKVTIISSDHTRPVPSRITMPLILKEIRKGNPDADITILVATGFHRPSTEEELIDKYGEKIVKDERIIIHDCSDSNDLVNIGTLPSGQELKINKIAARTDLLVAEGFIEPHFFAGFSGGRKSILPGIASRDNIMGNHCSHFINQENARTGNLEGNPLHEEMLAAADLAELDFILNVVINDRKEIISAFAGHYRKAHEKGCEFVDNIAGVEKKPADIVITTNGGYPLDQNIYQTVKSMTAAEATCKKGGVIIAVAECSDGHGGESFYKTFAKSDSPEAIREEILSREKEETIPDQWESQILARVLAKHEVIMVTEVNEKIVENMFMHRASDIESALKMAEKMVNKDNYEVTVIPDGVSVIV
ncbi:MAG: nickel-dependent lactate racemase, partial [Halanaerobiaceae bacterium]